MEWLKSLLASWKVRIALVGGALVIATSYGTCTLDPSEVSDAGTTTAAPSETVEVSTTTETTTPSTNETTPTTNTSGE